MSTPPASTTISPHLLQDLLEQGIISQTTYNTATTLLPKPRWQNWIQQMLLLVGVSLFIAGVIFFFAYNWADMVPAYKFSVIQLAVLIFAGLSHYLGMRNLSGQTCLCGCVVLIGVLMAVFGQIYQTGADSYELFMGWAILTIGLVIYGRFAPLWFIWISIGTTGIALFWDQVAHPVYLFSSTACFLSIALFHTIAVILLEIGFRKQYTWLQARWLPPLLLTSIFICLTIPIFDLIFDFNDSDGLIQATGLIWVLAIIATYFWYRYKQPDFIGLFLMATTLCSVTIALICKLIFEFIFDAHLDDTVFLISGIVILGCVGSTAVWLKKLHLTLVSEVQL